MFNKNLVKFLVVASTVAGIPAFAAPSNEGGVTKTQVKVGSSCCAERARDNKVSFARKMGLSDEQLEKIAALKDQQRVATASQKAQLKALSDQLKDVMTKPELDKQAALGLQGKINDLRAQLSNEKLEERINFMAVLTPEQKEILRHRILASEAFGGSFHKMRHHLRSHQA